MSSLLILLIASVAQAQEPSVAVTEDLEIRYWSTDQRLPDFPDQPVYDYVEQVNRLTLRTGFGQGPVTQSLWAQIDQVALFGNRYYLDDQLLIERDLVTPSLYSPFPGDSYANLEKLTWTLESESLSVAAGDSYASFGRGLALDLGRNVDIDVDTSVQGAKTVATAGLWDITAVAGWLNRQQVFQDNPNVGLRPDLKHGVAGVRVDRFGLGPANIGAHGVVYDFVDVEGWSGLGTYGTPDAVVGGGTVEAFGIGGLDWFFEGDVYAYPTARLFLEGEHRTGYALYGSSTAYVGRTVWQFEGKRYRDADRINAVVGPELYKVAVGPTLEYERVITEDSAAALSSNDIYGGRVRVDWAAIPVKLVPNLSVAVFRDQDLGSLHFNAVPETIVHPVAGLEAIGDHLSVIGYCGVRFDDRDGAEYGADRQIHGDLDVKFPIAGQVHGDIALAVERYAWGKNPFQQTDYTEIESGVTLQVGSKVAFTWFTDYTSNPLVDSTGNLTDAVYGAGELQFKPLPSLTVKAFYGAYKAGIRCSGGQCRLLPGFDGARVSVTGQF